MVEDPNYQGEDVSKDVPFSDQPRHDAPETLQRRPDESQEAFEARIAKQNKPQEGAGDDEGTKEPALV